MANSPFLEPNLGKQPGADAMRGEACEDKEPKQIIAKDSTPEEHGIGSKFPAGHPCLRQAVAPYRSRSLAP